MMSQEDLHYSEEGQSARVLLYQGFNDINVFVEDRDKEYEYEVLLKRVLGHECRVAAIFSANGKIGVKDRYNEFGISTQGIKNFYIVDGDFDRYIHQSEMVNDQCFIYLEPYNIENHLLDEEAVILYIQGKKRMLYTDAKNLVDFTTWKERIVNQAKNLFFLYCYVQSQGLGIENVGRSPYNLLDEDGFEKENAYNDYKKEVESYAPVNESVLQEIQARYCTINGENYYRLICGKFLFASLVVYLRKKAQVGIKVEDFRWFLVTHFNPTCLDYVKQRILA